MMCNFLFWDTSFNDRIFNEMRSVKDPDTKFVNIFKENYLYYKSFLTMLYHRR